jgi:hypothetical protein
MKVENMKLPFSHYGSYLVISPLYGRNSDPKSLYIRHIRGGDEKDGAIFKIELVRGNQEIVYEVEWAPHVLKLITTDGSLDIVECCFSSDRTIRIKGADVGVKLTAITGSYDYALAFPDKTWEINSFLQERRFRIIPLEGDLNVDAPFEVDKSKHITVHCDPNPISKTFDMAISEYQLSYQLDHALEMPFRDNAEQAANDYQQWQENTLQVPSSFQKGHDLASYITWSCVVKPDGLLTRPAMYMSKNWMTNIWSWDHCFNAMALSEHQPELAWDQFCIFFDQQDDSGALPDFLNDQWALWNCCKPPIHGWTLKHLMKNTAFVTLEKLAEVYERLVKWTKWWLRYRDDDLDGIPQYNHGNDSGWDNSTIFHKGTPVESPDLSSFLVLQIEVLAEIAGKLGKQDEANEWMLKSQELLSKMIDHFWDGEKFTAKRSGSHEVIESDSLVLSIPLILGKRLPAEILTRLVDDIKHKGFLTEYGLATELPQSQFYKHDGYWRGPIWAPTTLLVVDGLIASGEKELALEIAKRFCTMAAESGMAENFNALTGEGLRDPAFTWTSSVFLILGHLLLEK